MPSRLRRKSEFIQLFRNLSDDHGVITSLFVSIMLIVTLRLARICLDNNVRFRTLSDELLCSDTVVFISEARRMT